MACQSPDCKTHQEIVGFKYPLPHFRAALKSRRKVKVVAIGSSSTAGADKVLPFPPRLEMLLRDHFKGSMIDVVNRGIGGQEAPEELSRFESDVVAEAPALVIWQVGTNAVYRYKSYNPDDVANAIAVGLGWLAALPTDMVLMDLQYTKAMIDMVVPCEDLKLPLSEAMVARIATVAEGAKPQVNVFRRFALMRQWEKDGVSRDTFDDGYPERLHTSKWATNCVAQALSEAIVNAPVGASS
jgi:acyl-CoA thioesterase I